MKIFLLKKSTDCSFNIWSSSSNVLWSALCSVLLLKGAAQIKLPCPDRCLHISDSAPSSHLRSLRCVWITLSGSRLDTTQPADVWERPQGLLCVFFILPCETDAVALRGALACNNHSQSYFYFYIYSFGLMDGALSHTCLHHTGLITSHLMGHHRLQLSHTRLLIMFRENLLWPASPDLCRL